MLSLPETKIKSRLKGMLSQKNRSIDNNVTYHPCLEFMNLMML